jgi:hypothetical protein
MGKARILVDAVPGRADRFWNSRLHSGRGESQIVRSSGLVRARELRRLAGGSLTVVSGREAYSPAERCTVFSCSRALTTYQVESGDFEVAVVEW